MANTRGKNESSDRFYLGDLQESTCNAGDPGLIPGLGRSPGEGKGYPHQYSDLENSMDIHGIEKGQTQLSDFHSLTQEFQKPKFFQLD